MNIQDITACLSNILWISQNFMSILHSPWKFSYRAIIADNVSVLCFEMKKIAEYY